MDKRKTSKNDHAKCLFVSFLLINIATLFHFVFPVSPIPVARITPLNGGVTHVRRRPPVRSQRRCASVRCSAAPPARPRRLARGRVELYPPHGKYQLIVDALEPRGAGALALQLEQVKARESIGMIRYADGRELGTVDPTAAKAVGAHGAIVHLIADHYPDDATLVADEVWIEAGCSRGWCLLT